MILEARLRELVAIVCDEARRNPPFRGRLSDLFATGMMPDQPQGAPLPGVDDAPATPARARQRHRRAPAVLDPLEELRRGETHLRACLVALDLEQLRDIMAERGLDPKRLAAKWKTHSKVVDHIVAMTIQRDSKGEGFR